MSLIQCLLSTCYRCPLYRGQYPLFSGVLKGVPQFYSHVIYVSCPIMLGAPLTDCVRECQVGELPSMLQSAPVTLSGLFLNVDLPATCSGAIMTLRTCFYPQECTQNFSNTVNFTMWRPVGNGTFQLVSNSSFSILLTRPEEATYDFVCQSWKLSEATTIYVEKGDVMGIMDMGAGCTLLRSNVPFHALYHLADNMPQLEVHQSQLDTLTEYAFYITAGIGKIARVLM